MVESIDDARLPAPPRWLILVTGVFTVLILVMAVAETSLWTHYLIDQGEVVCLGGLVFTVAAGIALARRGLLAVSLPLFAPWLLYPVVTQGDQIIDNLDIQGMRLFVHVILAMLFLLPLPLARLAVGGWRLVRSERSHRWGGSAASVDGSASSDAFPLVAALLFVEIGIAHAYLGSIMVWTLIGLAVAYLLARQLRRRSPPDPRKPRVSERVALGLLLAGVTLSVALYLGYKYRPGAYQGSPHHYHDPNAAVALYDMGAIVAPVPTGGAPAAPVLDDAREVLGAYAEALRGLLGAYHVLDRNYNYAFHNALFLRHTPVVPDFRRVALDEIERSRALAARARELERQRKPALAQAAPLDVLVDEVASYAEFSFHRADLLAEMSGRFEATEAGLQHATHLYEGEGKMLSVDVLRMLEKHRAVLDDAAYSDATRDFVAVAVGMHQLYADRIVGF